MYAAPAGSYTNNFLLCVWHFLLLNVYRIVNGRRFLLLYVYCIVNGRRFSCYIYLIVNGRRFLLIILIIQFWVDGLRVIFVDFIINIAPTWTKEHSFSSYCWILSVNRGLEYEKENNKYILEHTIAIVIHCTDNNNFLEKKRTSTDEYNTHHNSVNQYFMPFI